MKQIFYIVVFLLATNVFSQIDTLNIQIANTPGTEFNFDLILTIKSPVELNPGVLFEIPAELNAIPVSIQVDKKKYWLKNSPEVSTFDNVATWQITERGLIVLFKKDQILESRKLEVECLITLMDKENSKQKAVQLHKLIMQGNTYHVAKQIFIRKKLPLPVDR